MGKNVTRNSEAWKLIKGLPKDTKEKVHFIFILFKKTFNGRTTTVYKRRETIRKKTTEKIKLTPEEVKKNIKQIKNNKSAGPGCNLVCFFTLVNTVNENEL